jgi:hypothetical protein
LSGAFAVQPLLDQLQARMHGDQVRKQFFPARDLKEGCTVGVGEREDRAA